MITDETKTWEKIINFSTKNITNPKQERSKMKYYALFNVAKMIYQTILRDLLIKAVSDPNQEWDDVVINLTDKIFDYKEEK